MGVELTNTANVGSQGYKSPEVRWPVDGKTKYGTPCDTWSIGALLYKVCTGKKFVENEEVLKNKAQYVEHLTTKLLTLKEGEGDFLEKFLMFNPQDRVACEQG